MRRGTVLVLLVLVALLGCAPVPTAGQAGGPPIALVRRGDLWLWEGGEERLLAAGRMESAVVGNGDIRRPRFSHDGRFVAYQRGRALQVTGLPYRGPWTVPGTPHQWAWSPAESILAVLMKNGIFTIRVGPRGLGKPAPVVRGDQWVSLAWSPDGKQIAVSRREPSAQNQFEGKTVVAVVPSNGGEPRVVLEERYSGSGGGCGSGATAASWSPDARWLLLIRPGITASIAADCNEFAVVGSAGGKAVTLGTSPNPRRAVWNPSHPSLLALVDGHYRTASRNKRLRLASPPWASGTGRGSARPIPGSEGGCGPFWGATTRPDPR